jgi:hypothetical protein
LARLAAADDHDVSIDPSDLDLLTGRVSSGVRPVHYGQGWQPGNRVALDGQPRAGGLLAGPDVGDAIDRRQAVPAVTG